MIGLRPNGLPFSRRKRDAKTCQRYRVVCQGQSCPSFPGSALPAGGAGSSILPRRSRPPQAHASRRSFQRRHPPRAVLTRRSGSGYPAPRCQLTPLLSPHISVLHRLDRNPGRCALPPRQCATTSVRRHTAPPCAAFPQHTIGYRTL
jgi:hypothetical protein